MNSNSQCVNDMPSLFDWLDGVLVDAGLDKDVKATALIALGFCNLLEGRLDNDQRAAVTAARDFLLSGEGDARDKWMIEFASRLEMDRSHAGSKERLAQDRLIWAALNSNTGLSSYAGEFLIGVGEDAGLGYKEMHDVILRCIPGAR